MSLQAEKLALGLILGSLRNMGWEHYELDDGDGWEFVGDKSIEQVVEDCAAVDDCGLRMTKDGEGTGTLFIVWGNSPSDLIADCNSRVEKAVDAALKALWPNWPDVEEAHETEGYLRLQVHGRQVAESQKLPQTPEQYATEGGTRCPYCGSWDLEGGSVTAEAGAAWQGISCNDCGESWQDQYKLVGYQPEDAA